MKVFQAPHVIIENPDSEHLPEDFNSDRLMKNVTALHAHSKKCYVHVTTTFGDAE